MYCLPVRKPVSIEAPDNNAPKDDKDCTLVAVDALIRKLVVNYRGICLGLHVRVNGDRW